MKTTKKKLAKGEVDEIEIIEGGMQAKFIDEPAKSKSPNAAKKSSASKDKTSKSNIYNHSDLTAPAKSSNSKLVKNADMFENNLAAFNEMLTFSILRSNFWTKEIFFDTTYCSFLEQFIELVPKINSRRTVLLYCPGFVKGLFEFTLKLICNHSNVHFNEL